MYALSKARFSSCSNRVISLAPSARDVLVTGLIIVGVVMQVVAAQLCSLVPERTRSEVIVPSVEIPAGTDSWAPRPPWLPTLVLPIEGINVPTDEHLLPGAVRSYRGGVHEGVDFPCSPGTEIRAVCGGRVLDVRDEHGLPESFREEILRASQTLGKTPTDVLEVLHGKRITIYHGTFGGRVMTSSYSHLGAIRQDLTPGMAVRQGEVIGSSGNSGTSHAYSGDVWGELHFEIHINGDPLGLGLAPAQAGALYRAALRGRQIHD